MNAQDPPDDEIQTGAPSASDPTARGRRPWRRRSHGGRGGALLSLGVLAIIVILAGLARTSAGRRETAALGVRTDREPYTALSFTGASAGKLGFTGVRYHGARIHDRFSFKITNAQHHAQHYAWTLDFDPAGHVYHGSVFLTPGASQTFTPTVLFPCDADVLPARRHLHMVRVRVRLAPTGESIDFLQECDD